MREIQKWVGEECYMEVRRLLMLLTQWEKKQRERSCKGISCEDGEGLSTDDLRLFHYFVCAELTLWCWGCLHSNTMEITQQFYTKLLFFDIRLTL